jgi:hypothetical protein
LEYNSVELSLCKEFHSFSVDQSDVLKIDGNRTRLVLDYVAKCVQIPLCYSAADAQRGDAVTADDPIDSAAHSDIEAEAFVFPVILFRIGPAVIGSPCTKGKPLAIRKSLKIINDQRRRS